MKHHRLLMLKQGKKSWKAIQLKKEETPELQRGSLEPKSPDGGKAEQGRAVEKEDENHGRNGERKGRGQRVRVGIGVEVVQKGRGQRVGVGVVQTAERKRSEGRGRADCGREEARGSRSCGLRKGRGQRVGVRVEVARTAEGKRPKGRGRAGPSGSRSNEIRVWTLEDLEATKVRRK
ncbi:hypothetical protein CDL15_Pgr019408 [Punica granatum]|uniref:Uncharacterized protein n=1 Tax=Punica granatum TaxID=22663 RepID=A0A218XSB5_PUNGR|nr:hypothetical protein CDL15_Pgr019408 [Punica granatum]